MTEPAVSVAQAFTGAVEHERHSNVRVLRDNDRGPASGSSSNYKWGRIWNFTWLSSANRGKQAYGKKNGTNQKNTATPDFTGRGKSLERTGARKLG